MVEKMTEKAMDGFNCTLLAYGQTGAGKTYTISGATENYKLRGIIPRVLSKVSKCFLVRRCFTIKTFEACEL